MIDDNSHQDIMDEFEEAGWKRTEDVSENNNPEKKQKISEQDIDKMFKLIDADGSGEISKRVSL